MVHEVLLVALLVLLVVLILLLSIPVKLRGRVQFDTIRRDLYRRLRLTWLFGLVSTDLVAAPKQARAGEGDVGDRESVQTGEAEQPPRDRSQKRPPETEKDEEGTMSKVRQRTRQGRRVWAAASTDGFWEAVGNLARRSLHAAQVEEVDVQARVGTGDPADTGMLYGYMTPAQYALSQVPRTEVRLEPVWDQTVLDADGRARVSAVPLFVVWAVILFALTPAVWKAGWRYWRSKDA